MNPIVYNFTIQASDSTPVPADNRAFCYGDGLFETMIARGQDILFWEDHYQRLTLGMLALFMEIPADFTAVRLQELMQQLMQAKNLTDYTRLRLQVWRKPGGLYTPATRAVDFIVTAQSCPPPRVSVKEKARFYEAVPLVASPFSAYKTCNALPYVLAGIAREEAAVDDMILLSAQGHVAECLASNLFWYRSGTFYTPALSTGCVAGVMRKQLLRLMREHAIPVREGWFSKEELLAADWVFCCNVAGIQEIRRIEGRLFDERPGEEAELLFRWG